MAENSGEIQQAEIKKSKIPEHQDAVDLLNQKAESSYNKSGLTIHGKVGLDPLPTAVTETTNTQSRDHVASQIRHVRREKKLADEARIDATGFHNRVWLLEETQRDIAEAKRTGKPVYMLFIDLDNFKSINSYYKYEGGDAVVELIKKLPIREEEIIGRWGGDEFVQPINENLQESDIHTITNRYQETIQRISRERLAELKLDQNRNIAEFPDEKAPRVTTLSIGVAKWEGETPEEFLDKASTAAKYSKDHGKAQATVIRKNPNATEEEPYIFESIK